MNVIIHHHSVSFSTSANILTSFLSCMNVPHGPMGFSQKLLDITDGLNPNNSNNPPPDPRGTSSLPMVPKHCLYTGVSVETVKLNFHLELHATLVHNLNSGLGLELQVLCKQVSRKSLDRYQTAENFPAGRSICVILRGLFMSLLENTQLSQTAAFNSLTHIGVFFLDVLQDNIFAYPSHSKHIKINISLPYRLGENCIITEWIFVK